MKNTEKVGGMGRQAHAFSSKRALVRRRFKRTSRRSARQMGKREITIEE